MLDSLEEETVLLIDTLLPEKDVGSGSIGKSVKVWLIGESSFPILSVSGHVTGWCLDETVIDDTGQRLVKTQIEVSLEEMLSLWNSVPAFQAGGMTEAVNSHGESHFVFGQLVTSPEENDSPAP